MVRTEVVPESVVKDSSQFPESWLEKKAVFSMESFMDGEVEYFVAAPVFWEKVSETFVVRPLVFRNFSKSNRPRAWKNCDLRIQSTLPVLGIADDSSIRKEDHSDGNESVNPDRIVRVSMALKSCDGEE